MTKPNTQTPKDKTKYFWMLVQDWSEKVMIVVVWIAAIAVLCATAFFLLSIALIPFYWAELEEPGTSLFLSISLGLAGTFFSALMIGNYADKKEREAFYRRAKSEDPDEG